MFRYMANGFSNTKGSLPNFASNIKWVLAH